MCSRWLMVGLALVAISRLLQAGEPKVHVAGDAVVLFEIDATAVEQIIKDNKLSPLKKWPLLQTTGYPELGFPRPLKERAKREPEWKGGDLGLYHVTVKMTDSDRRNGAENISYFLYHPAAKTLVIVIGKSNSKE